jgi:indole-3-glycerol phosphate synthase
MDWRHVESTRPPAPRVAASEVRPSIRDFTQYLGAGRAALAVIPLLARRDVIGDVAALAAELDALEIPALAVATAPDAGALDDLVAVVRAVSAPVLRYDCVIDEDRLYESRLAGADAVLVPAALAGAELPRLVSLARAIHVACVVEVATAADCAAASAAGAPVVALARGALALASTISPRRPLLAQETIATVADLGRLRGIVDAVLVATGSEAEAARRVATLVAATDTESAS